MVLALEYHFYAPAQTIPLKFKRKTIACKFFTPLTISHHYFEATLNTKVKLYKLIVLKFIFRKSYRKALFRYKNQLIEG